MAKHKTNNNRRLMDVRVVFTEHDRPLVDFIRTRMSAEHRKYPQEEIRYILYKWFETETQFKAVDKTNG